MHNNNRRNNYNRRNRSSSSSSCHHQVVSKSKLLSSSSLLSLWTSSIMLIIIVVVVCCLLLTSFVPVVEAVEAVSDEYRTTNNKGSNNNQGAAKSFSSSAQHGSNNNNQAGTDNTELSSLPNDIQKQIVHYQQIAYQYPEGSHETVNAWYKILEIHDNNLEAHLTLGWYLAVNQPVLSLRQHGYKLLARTFDSYFMGPTNTITAGADYNIKQTYIIAHLVGHWYITEKQSYSAAIQYLELALSISKQPPNIQWEDDENQASTNNFGDTCTQMKLATMYDMFPRTNKDADKSFETIIKHLNLLLNPLIDAWKDPQMILNKHMYDGVLLNAQKGIRRRRDVKNKNNNSTTTNDNNEKVAELTEELKNDIFTELTRDIYGFIKINDLSMNHFPLANRDTYNYCIYSSGWHLNIYQIHTDIRNVASQQYQMIKRAWPKLDTTANFVLRYDVEPKLRPCVSNRKIKLAIVVGSSDLNNQYSSIAEEFSAMFQRLDRQKFDITFVYVPEEEFYDDPYEPNNDNDQQHNSKPTTTMKNIYDFDPNTEIMHADDKMEYFVKTDLEFLKEVLWQNKHPPQSLYNIPPVPENFPFRDEDQVYDTSDPDEPPIECDYVDTDPDSPCHPSNNRNKNQKKEKQKQDSSNDAFNIMFNGDFTTLWGAKIASLEFDTILYLDTPLSGHAKRLAMQRLAPVQIATHGYPITSGHPSDVVHYFISWQASEQLSYANAQEFYTEELKLLPANIPSNYFIPRIQTGVEGSIYEGKQISRIDGKPFEHLTRSMLLLLDDPKGKSDVYINFAMKKDNNGNDNGSSSGSSGSGGNNDNQYAGFDDEEDMYGSDSVLIKDDDDDDNEKYAGNTYIKDLESNYGIIIKSLETKIHGNTGYDKVDMEYTVDEINDKNIYTCMQDPFKIHPEFDEMLCNIIKKDTNGILVLHEANKHLLDNPKFNHQTFYEKRLVDAGCNLSQIIFLPRQAHHRLLALYKTSTVVLDSYPAGGQVTTREVLELGKAMVTLPTRMLGGRWSAGYMHTINLSNTTKIAMIATVNSEYVDLAVALANDESLRWSVERDIQNNIHKLFHSDEAVLAWEDMLLELSPIERCPDSDESKTKNNNNGETVSWDNIFEEIEKQRG